jgi:MOSC domain-containing protein YiiM
MANVLAVNLAHSRPNPDKGQLLTGIDKRPTDGPIAVRAPGPMDGGAGSGLVGDFIGDSQVHGGDDQAVYAYAREDLDVWRRELERDLGNGMFGENITTKGLDVTGARIGERWQVGSDGLVRCRGPVSRVGRLRPGWRSRAGSRHSPGPQRPARTSG